MARNMESHHAETPASAGTAIITSRLRNLSDEFTSIIETLKYGKLQLTHEEYDSLETASLDFAETAASVTEEVKTLGRRRKDAVVIAGQKLLSDAERVKSEMMSTHELKNRVTFIRNLQLLFKPPEESKLDSLNVQNRKKLTRERCERIRSLPLNKIILWAAAFPPTAWYPNTLPKITFDFVIEFLDPVDSFQWPASLNELLTSLGTEQPLRDSSGFNRFMTCKYVP